MTETPKPDDKSTKSPAKRPIVWKPWLGLALFIAFCVGAQLEASSNERKAQNAAAWKGAARQLGDEVCDSYEWSQTFDKCDTLAKEARKIAQQRLQKYQ